MTEPSKPTKKKKKKKKAAAEGGEPQPIPKPITKPRGAKAKSKAAPVAPRSDRQAPAQAQEEDGPFGKVVLAVVSLLALVAVAAWVATSGPSSSEEPGSDEPRSEAEPADEADEEPANTGSRPPGQAPNRFTVRFDTTEGPLLIDVHREWAPRGADRFYELVREGYYTDVAFFRVVEGFMAQAGIHGDPAMNTRWRERRIPDDPPSQSNTRGMVSYAMAGPGSRTTQFFINFADNSRLDRMGFAPFGRVRDMSVVDRLHSGYGEGAPSGRGPDQSRMQREGNTYLRADFPELDYIRRATIVEE